ncbi:hypothetical protein [Bradyrhizobium sp. 192]|uniref:hypothetical protein n=1 Tax=Bradyrhizobium sp. 192 TaxID=2782660 RepID=UPI001FFE89FA|nr:hypothetical protein [Bradyrhizobium sp. 192]UPJ60712.1 hypothetical protein IVB24_14390 [Bradyrhizobium sp. 192]
MPDELLVILGAEATILASVAVITLYARRMDVLSGRSFERSVASPTRNRHPLRSIRRKPRGLLRLIRKWGDLTTFATLNFVRRFDILRALRWGTQTGPQTPSQGVMPFRQPRTPAAKAALPGPDRNADPQG